MADIDKVRSQGNFYRTIVVETEYSTGDVRSRTA